MIFLKRFFILPKTFVTEEDFVNKTEVLLRFPSVQLIITVQNAPLLPGAQLSQVLSQGHTSEGPCQGLSQREAFCLRVQVGVEKYPKFAW